MLQIHDNLEASP